MHRPKRWGDAKRFATAPLLTRREWAHENNLDTSAEEKRSLQILLQVHVGTENTRAVPIGAKQPKTREPGAVLELSCPPVAGAACS